MENGRKAKLAVIVKRAEKNELISLAEKEVVRGDIYPFLVEN